MAYNIKFVKGTAEQYASLATKDANTLYFITDAGKETIYLGTKKFTSVEEVAAAVTRISANEGDIDTIQSALSGIDLSTQGSVKSLIDAVSNALGAISSLETTNKTTAVAAINELKTALGNLSTSSSITLTKDTTAADGMASTYTLSQGGIEIGKINIPKDLVVESGSVVKATAQNPVNGNTSGTYIVLNIQNGDTLYIAASDLVDIYQGAQSATEVQVTVNGYTISATIVAGAVTAEKLAADSVTTAKIADGNVTAAKLATDSVTTEKIVNGAVTTEKLGANAVTTGKINDGAVTNDKLAAGSVSNTKLDSDLQSAISKANSAVQTVAEGSTNGTVSVDGTDVPVHGLGSAAYQATTAFDAAGAATAAQSAVTGTAADSASTLTLNGVSKKVEEAISTCEEYTDTALTWGSF